MNSKEYARIVGEMIEYGEGKYSGEEWERVKKKLGRTRKGGEMNRGKGEKKGEKYVSMFEKYKGDDGIEPSSMAPRERRIYNNVRTAMIGSKTKLPMYKIDKKGEAECYKVLAASGLFEDLDTPDKCEAALKEKLRRAEEKAKAKEEKALLKEEKAKVKEEQALLKEEKAKAKEEKTKAKEADKQSTKVKSKNTTKAKSKKTTKAKSKKPTKAKSKKTTKGKTNQLSEVDELRKRLAELEAKNSSNQDKDQFANDLVESCDISRGVAQEKTVINRPTTPDCSEDENMSVEDIELKPVESMFANFNEEDGELTIDSQSDCDSTNLFGSESETDNSVGLCTSTITSIE